ncbi:hypothetical protein [Novipirellula artificiosorum]|uniref:Transmembrane protein n=1 Tax=Novipirellula artificiosorum TaxID=2528016 RepID=A0A5C6D7X2_9BACT|nr:hypothetical protein [Novipirellula artificiosorum]TWU30989.1 hypothetical protein Poly41_64580 [Novipirellula artificiosorum]
MTANHDDKFNDPRARITPRGILIGVGIAALAVIGAAASIRGRRTQLDETRSFWGDDTVTALQLGERMEVILLGDAQAEPIELTAMPGLGLLRHALLDERSYDWTSRGSTPLASRTSSRDDATEPNRIRLRITDPNAKRFEPIEIDLELSSGWVGDAAATKSVRLNDRTEPKLRNYFKTVIHSEQKRSDFRE